MRVRSNAFANLEAGLRRLQSDPFLPVATDRSGASKNMFIRGTECEYYAIIPNIAFRNRATPVKKRMTLCVRVAGIPGSRLKAPRTRVTKKLETTIPAPMTANAILPAVWDMVPSDTAERRGASPAPNEGTLSHSSTLSLAH